MRVKTLKDILTGLDDDTEVQIRQNGIIKPIKPSGFIIENGKQIVVFNI